MRFSRIIIGSVALFCCALGSVFAGQFDQRNINSVTGASGQPVTIGAPYQFNRGLTLNREQRFSQGRTQTQKDVQEVLAYAEALKRAAQPVQSGGNVTTLKDTTVVGGNVGNTTGGITVSPVFKQTAPQQLAPTGQSTTPQANATGQTTGVQGSGSQADALATQERIAMAQIEAAKQQQGRAISCEKKKSGGGLLGGLIGFGLSLVTGGAALPLIGTGTGIGTAVGTQGC